VYRCLSGQLSIDPDVLRTCLRLRIPKLRNCTDPFPKPSVTSSAAIRSGSIELPDGTTLQVDDHEAIIWKISERFNLDEIEAYILLRSFLYNEHLEYSPTAKEDEASSAEESLLESITDFLFEERLFVLRIFPPLYRAQADDQHLYHDIAVEILHEVAPDPTALVSTLVSQYIRRTKQEIPSKQPRKTTMPLSMRAKWAKQIVKEQICMMEIIFWGTYNMRCPGSLIAELYEAVYSTSLGSAQNNGDVLLEEESIQLLADLESVMVVTAVQVLGVELLNEQSIDLEVVSLPRHGYFAQPAELERIHTLVCTTPTQPRFSPIVLAWTCVIRRIASAAETDNYPQEYVPLLATLAPEQGGRDSVWQEFTRVVLNPAMGLFPTLRTLLSSPLLDTEAAATAGSSLSNPNDNVVRAIIKGTGHI
jgi:nuclear pore complex protein Nup188